MVSQNSPKLQYMTVTWLMRHAVPVSAHPPLLTTDRNTSLAEFLGQRTQSATNVISHPAPWPKREIVSSIGRTPAPTVLNAIVTTIKANIMHVYCQLVKVNEALVTSIAA